MWIYLVNRGVSSRVNCVFQMVMENSTYVWSRKAQTVVEVRQDGHTQGNKLIWSDPTL